MLIITLRRCLRLSPCCGGIDARASVGIGGWGGRPAPPCLPWSDRGSPSECLGGAAQTADSGAWQTRCLGRGGGHGSTGRVPLDSEGVAVPGGAAPPFQLVFIEHRFH